MNKLIYILIIAFVIGCSLEIEKPLKRPLVIIYKMPRSIKCNTPYCSYKYIDASGNVRQFCDDESKYDIGDTIK